MRIERSEVLVVSDLHYEKAWHHDTWEGDAFEWLVNVVQETKPISLILLGDSGHAWLHSDWRRVSKLTRVNAVYGNHDNLEVLRSAKNKDGTRVLAEDGEVRVIGGLKVGFINGIMAEGGAKVKDGVPRKSPEDFFSAAAKLTGIDVLVTHASPNLPEYGRRYHATKGFEALDQVLAEINPVLSLSGHLRGPFTLSKLRGATVLRVESSAAERHYALLEFGTGQIRIMHDHSQVRTGSFAGPSPH